MGDVLYYALLLGMMLGCFRPALAEPPSSSSPANQIADDRDEGGPHWKPILLEAGLFLGIQHGFRIGTEPATRDNLRGPFVRDYLTSTKSLRGWGDGDPPLVNYVGHPMMGAVTGYIFVQNDPRGRGEVFGKHGSYWRSRLRAMAFTTAYSLQFELGPLSESSIGNVGIDQNGHGAVDLVVTPALGLAWQTTEDALDRLVVEPLERRVHNRYAKLALRAGLNPSRSFSNLLRIKVPWYRDTREHGVGFN